MDNKFISQGWLCPRCGKINAPWMSQCNCSGKPMEITCGSAEKGILSPGYYTTVIPTSYPISYSTSTTPVIDAQAEAFITLTGKISEEVKEQLREWRKDPAADYFDVKFAPVKRGQWIDGKCSECGCFKPIKEMTCNGSIMWTLRGEMNYCPNCGARMENSR